MADWWMVAVGLLLAHDTDAIQDSLEGGILCIIRNTDRLVLGKLWQGMLSRELKGFFMNFLDLMLDAFLDAF